MTDPKSFWLTSNIECALPSAYIAYDPTFDIWDTTRPSQEIALQCARFPTDKLIEASCNAPNHANVSIIHQVIRARFDVPLGKN